MHRHALLIGVREYPYVDDAGLGGPKNDVILIGTLLRDRFDFPEENLHILLDEEATQAGIRVAMDESVERVGENDVFVFFYSGHGSRMADPGRPGRMLESIVPHDSGRGKWPNRDIPDVELGRFVRRLNVRTPYVTLIFDCCHSQTMTRDPIARAARSIEPDHRRPEEMFDEAVTRSLDGTPDLRHVSGGYRAVVVAACRPDEEAQEHVVREAGTSFLHGALTCFLGRALTTAAPGATWRDVFETVAPAVTTRFPRQHPQVEGHWDQMLFDIRDVSTTPYLRLITVADGTVELSGGAAHGVTAGSLYSVHASDTSGEVARIRVESVGVATSTAVLEPDAPAELAVGQRVFLREHHLPSPGLKVCLDTSAEELRPRIRESPLLAETEPADVVVRHLAPRTSVAAGDPCPYLGPLAHATWAAVGEDGELVVRARRDDEAAALVGDLVGRTRYDRLLEIENADPKSRLRGRVRLLVTQRRDGGAFVPAVPRTGDGLLSFAEGDVVDFEIRNEYDEAVWITLLQLGCDGSVSRLVPLRKHPTYQPSGYRLEAGEGLRLSDYYRQDFRFHHWDGVHVELPAERFPREGDAGLVYLKLMVTLEPADFELVEQSPLLGALETRDPGTQAHPLLHLVRLYGTGRGKRVVAPSAEGSQDWTTVTRSVVLRGVAPTVSDSSRPSW